MTVFSPLARRRPRGLLAAVALLAFAACDSAPAPIPLLPAPNAIEARPGGLGVRDSIRYVIHISIDGLRADAIGQLPESLAPTFARLRRESARTNNARTDPDYRYTLPNHVTQLTGRTALGSSGHGWTENDDVRTTIHANRGLYVPSVFDVAHDHGRRTAAYVSKEKFSLFEESYGPGKGAPDQTGEDNGSGKLDIFYHHPDTDLLVRRLASDLKADPSNYTFLHLRDPDVAGHEFEWSIEAGSQYLDAVQRTDARIGTILETIEADTRLRGRTAIVMTSDHGGRKREHGTDHRDHITVPFYVWGPGIRPADLYALNPHREDPGSGQGDAPIRNGDAANLSLSLLGLEAVPGSTLGADRDLEVARR